MNKIVWTPEFDLGISIMDQQHQTICAAYNRFAECFLPGSGLDQARHFRDVIHAYVHHFLFEEDVMRAGGYPFYDSHSRVHALFIRRMIGLLARIEHGENVAEEVEQIAGRWLISHIRQEDMDYVASIGDDLNRLVRTDAPPWKSCLPLPVNSWPLSSERQVSPKRPRNVRANPRAEHPPSCECSLKRI